MLREVASIDPLLHAIRTTANPLEYAKRLPKRRFPGSVLAYDQRRWAPHEVKGEILKAPEVVNVKPLKHGTPKTKERANRAILAETRRFAIPRRHETQP